MGERKSPVCPVLSFVATRTPQGRLVVVCYIALLQTCIVLGLHHYSRDHLLPLWVVELCSLVRGVHERLRHARVRQLALAQRA